MKQANLALSTAPATQQQIIQALEILFSAMRFRPGVDPETAVAGYVVALEGCTLDEITSGLRKVLRGDVEGLVKTWCPSPPELAAAIRDQIRRTPVNGTGKLYRYKQPRSKIVAKKCTKDYAASLVRNGAAPRGSIWCPGEIGHDPHIGDLYGPDEAWKQAVPS
jgi:hypothetical protein